jgi:hypothetical protein
MIAIEDPARAHQQDPVREFDGQFRLMQRAQNCKAPRTGKLAHQSQNKACRIRIEAGDRLIREQDAAVLHQGPGNRHPLLLAARKRIRALVFLFGKPDGSKCGFCLFPEVFGLGPHGNPPDRDRGQNGSQHIGRS